MNVVDDTAFHSSEEAAEVLRLLRTCRLRLTSLDQHHAAAYADIAIQLLKQSIAEQEQHLPRT
jgi:hypothetical protein